ncbi:MAG: hypothetical protein PHD82_17275 [Candidatus Riflebacteria bacterium]|nr:hypothetical protein [Candidatus Riflebacteria bacterium]
MLRVKNSIQRSLQIMLSSLLMIWISWAYLVPDPANSFFAWAVIAFFFLTFSIGCFRLLDRRTKVMLDERGVSFPGRNSEMIAWEEISDFIVSEKPHSCQFYIVLKTGQTRRLWFFLLDTSHQAIQQLADMAIKRASEGICAAKPPQKVSAMGLADFVKDGQSDMGGAQRFDKPRPLPAGKAQTSSEVFADQYQADNESSVNETDYLDNRVEESRFVESEEDSKLLDPTVTSKTYLQSPWLFPPWFSNDGVVNEMLWFCAIFSGMTAFLFMASYLSDDLGGPPKIGIFEQLVIIICAGPLGAIAMYIRRFSDYSRYRPYQPNSRKRKMPDGQNQGKVKTRRKRR